jgi:hypothetical protein
MTVHDRRTPELDLLRSLPLEVSLDRVQQWVDQFPPPPPPKPWYAKLKTNFNIMMTISSLLVGGAIYLMSTLPTTTVPTVQPTVPAPAPVNMPMALPEAPTPPEDAAPAIAERGNPATSDTMLPGPDAATQPVHSASQNGPSRTVALPYTTPPPTAWRPSPLLADSEVSERRFDLTDFQAVKLDGMIDIQLRQGPFSVVASGPKDELQNVKARVVDGRLIISQKWRSGWLQFSSGKHVMVVVSMPQLDEFVLAGSGNADIGRFEGAADELLISLKGSGTLQIESLEQVKDLRLELLGSGDLICKEAVVSGKTDLRLAGSGALRILGRTDTVDIVLLGSGSLDAAGFEARTGNVDLIGSGDAEVSIEQLMRKKVQGSGDLQQVDKR